MGHAGFESNTNSKRRNRIKHNSEGKCYSCSKKVVDGKNYCKYHIEYSKKMYFKREQRVFISGLSTGYDEGVISEKERIIKIINKIKFKPKGSFPYYNEDDIKDLKKQLKRQIKEEKNE